MKPDLLTPIAGSEAPVFCMEIVCWLVVPPCCWLGEDTSRTALHFPVAGSQERAGGLPGPLSWWEVPISTGGLLLIHKNRHVSPLFYQIADLCHLLSAQGGYVLFSLRIAGCSVCAFQLNPGCIAQTLHCVQNVNTTTECRKIVCSISCPSVTSFPWSSVTFHLFIESAHSDWQPRAFHPRPCVVNHSYKISQWSPWEQWALSAVEL